MKPVFIVTYGHRCSMDRSIYDYYKVATKREAIKLRKDLQSDGYVRVYIRKKKGYSLLSDF